MNVLNNREIASIIWLSILFIYMIVDKKIRASIFGVVKSFCNWKVLTPVLLMIIYVCGIIVFLYQIGFWTTSLLKDSIIWVCLTGLVMLINSVTSKQNDYFSKTIKDNLKVVMIIEFLMNSYTFPLLGELIFLPFLTLVVMTQALAKTDEQYTQVDKILGWVQSYIGIIVLIFVLKNVVTHFSSFASLDTLREFLLAPILTFTVLPFIYVFNVIAAYELLFIRLDFGFKKSKNLKNYARVKIITYGRLNLQKVRDLLTHKAHALMNVETKDDVDKLIESFRV